MDSACVMEWADRKMHRAPGDYLWCTHGFTLLENSAVGRGRLSTDQCHKIEHYYSKLKHIPFLSKEMYKYNSRRG